MDRQTGHPRLVSESDEFCGCSKRNTRGHTRLVSLVVVQALDKSSCLPVFLPEGFRVNGPEEVTLFRIWSLPDLSRVLCLTKGFFQPFMHVALQDNDLIVVELFIQKDYSIGFSVPNFAGSD